jgi:hypothetical protein
MKKSLLMRLLVVACGVALVLGTFVGCQSTTSEEAQHQLANRTYMSSVNSVIETLNTKLAKFDEAVAEGNIVNMRSTAKEAFACIDDLKAIETPDSMKDLQSNYVDGCEKLQTALNDYIDLYSDVYATPEGESFDSSEYNERLKTIQDTYTEGIDKLKAADDAALELNK